MTDYEKKRRAIYIRADNREQANQQIDKCLTYADNTYDEDIDRRGVKPHNEDSDKGVTAIGQHDLVIVVENLSEPGDDATAWLNDEMDDNRISSVIIPDARPLRTQDITYISDETTGHIHLIDEGLLLLNQEEMSGRVKQAIRALTNEQRRTPETLLDGVEHKGGRPPLGTKVDDDGQLKADAEFESIRRTLVKTDRDEMSKKAAAEEIGCTRKTVSNALERRELYGLDDEAA